MLSFATAKTMMLVAGLWSSPQWAYGKPDKSQNHCSSN